MENSLNRALLPHKIGSSDSQLTESELENSTESTGSPQIDTKMLTHYEVWGALVAIDLTGKVVDENDNPVDGAAVIISKSPEGIRDIAVLTNQTGHFILFDLRPGSYELLANTMEGAMGVLTLNIVDHNVRPVKIVTLFPANND